MKYIISLLLLFLIGCDTGSGNLPPCDSTHWNVIEKDSIKWNTIKKDSIKWTTINKDSIKWHTINKDSIHWTTIYKDSIHWNIINKDSVRVRFSDTVAVISIGIDRRLTPYLNKYYKDTSKLKIEFNVVIKDSTRK